MENLTRDLLCFPVAIPVHLAEIMLKSFEADLPYIKDAESRAVYIHAIEVLKYSIEQGEEFFWKNYTFGRTFGHD